jgi:hypothetical protein
MARFVLWRRQLCFRLFECLGPGARWCSRSAFDVEMGLFTQVRETSIPSQLRLTFHQPSWSSRLRFHAYPVNQK